MFVAKSISSWARLFAISATCLPGISVIAQEDCVATAPSNCVAAEGPNCALPGPYYSGSSGSSSFSNDLSRVFHRSRKPRYSYQNNCQTAPNYAPAQHYSNAPMAPAAPSAAPSYYSVPRTVMTPTTVMTQQMVPMMVPMMVPTQVMQPTIVHDIVAAPRQFVSSAPAAAPNFEIPPAPSSAPTVSQAPAQAPLQAPAAAPQFAPTSASCAGGSTTALLMAMMLANQQAPAAAPRAQSAPSYDAQSRRLNQLDDKLDRLERLLTECAKKNK